MFGASLIRACRPTVHKPFLGRVVADSARFLSASAPSLARQAKKKKVAPKAARRKQTKSIYDDEKMSLTDAIQVLRAVEVACPNALYELTIKTGMPRGAPIPKGRISLPREPKKMARDRICVFAEGRPAEEAKAAGADYVGGLEMVEGVATGRIQASIFLCTPGLIRAITPRLGRILGPRGLMPSERRGTVLEDVGRYMRRLAGFEWKGDKAGTIRTPIAKMTWSSDEVIKNVTHFMNSVKQATGNTRGPSGDRKDANKVANPIMKVVLSSRQGPGIRLSDV
ncbi:ribosomal protein L1-like protein [Vararia minispora EC-137]|uniref:Ribosomal protein L1-like protein n=1 Tax=Vararia minispora EC-137 TaxID=1314806 RepID=A0ACB8QTN8_9AGAM|nr:ribosomal protein L1-like protein [Vararia minispora EC-137]